MTTRESAPIGRKGKGAQEAQSDNGHAALERVVGNYLRSGGFEEDFNELDPQKRIALFEKLLKYIETREEATGAEEDSGSRVYFSILDFVGRLTPGGGKR